mgnify:CR=1 FL=1
MKHQDLAEILLTEEEIAGRVRELADEINKKYPSGETLYCIGILKGSGMFMMDLVRLLKMPVEFDFMIVSSYGKDTVSSGKINILQDVRMPIVDKHILIVEDIIDTGNTLTCLKAIFSQRQPRSVKVATLLDKPSRRKQPFKADFVGFEIPDAFAVGYGLDYNEKYRNLPYIGVLKEEIWKK